MKVFYHLQNEGKWVELTKIISLLNEIKLNKIKLKLKKNVGV